MNFEEVAEDEFRGRCARSEKDMSEALNIINFLAYIGLALKSCAKDLVHSTGKKKGLTVRQTLQPVMNIKQVCP